MEWMWAASAVGMLAVIIWRVRETRRAMTTRSIILPPLAMSTGLLMFVVPQFRMPWWWALVAFLAGFFLLSYPLLRTSVLTRVQDQIVLRGSPAFMIVILGLALVRFALRSYIDEIVPPLETAAVFFLLAFGMIVRWRADMFRQFRALS
ncbi:MAG TPA: cytochrome c biogenesis protein CcdC [Longimicrobiales bacterium]|nr:cytochrome c biogenesis protein CcdC [Longimicrobiales bacterium]